MDIQSSECMGIFCDVKRARGGMDVNGGKKGKAGVGVLCLRILGNFVVDECAEYSLYKSWDSCALKGAPLYGGVNASPRSQKNRQFSKRYKQL